MKIITDAAVERALRHVTGELASAGLLTQRLYDVDVVVQTFDLGPFVANFEGLYVEEPTVIFRLLGFAPRTIYIPRIALARLVAGLRGQACSSMRDILRHELGHAFAVEHPGLVRRNAAFVRAFGARYDDDVTQDEDDCVSAYAATSPAEDFAETFMTYLRVRGDRARFKGRPAVLRKLRFVGELAKQVKRRDLAV